MSSILINRIVDFCNKRHPELFKTLPEWKLKSVLKKYRKNLIINKNGTGIKGVALFIRVSDRSFENIVSGKLKLKNIEDLYLIPFGKNIIFIGLVADGIKTIRDGLKKAINQEKPKSIAWYRDKNKKFFIVRR